jgi:quinolinate synthase
MDDLGTLKTRRAAIILAHNYQPDEVQDAADYVGDSFELSLLASRTEAEVIVFCGVHFMAEAAALLSPEKVVLLPDLGARCPLADGATPADVRALRAAHPGAAVVAYVNTTAAVKAESDVCVTSANAALVVAALPQEEIIFVPDSNLGRHIADRTGKRVITTGGGCPAHQAVKVEDVERARYDTPGAVVMVHPEVPPEVAARADLVLGTGGMVRQARERSEKEFVVGTEAGMLHRLRKDNSGKSFHLLSPALWCPDMKHTTLDKVAAALRDLSPRVEVSPEMAGLARRALERMLELAGGRKGPTGGGN